MWASTSSGRIELEMTLSQAQSASHSGSCDNDVALLLEIPAIKRQLNKFDPAILAKELRGYGTWDDEELADHAQNLARIVWILANDIAEEAFSKGK